MISEKFEDFKIFTGNSNIFLAKSIVGYLGMNLGEILSTRFPDGEIYVRCLESVRGKEVFVIQSTYSPSDNLMELLIMIDALKELLQGLYVLLFRFLVMQDRTGKRSQGNQFPQNLSRI